MNLPLSFLENEIIIMLLCCLPKWLKVTSWLSPSRQWHWPPAVTSYDRIWGGIKNLVKWNPMNHGYLTSFLTTSAKNVSCLLYLFVMLIVIHLVSCLSWGFKKTFHLMMMMITAKRGNLSLQNAFVQFVNQVGNFYWVIDSLSLQMTVFCVL